MANFYSYFGYTSLHVTNQSGLPASSIMWQRTAHENWLVTRHSSTHIRLHHRPTIKCQQVPITKCDVIMITLRVDNTDHTHNREVSSTTINTAGRWLDHWSHWTAAPCVDCVQHSNGFSRWTWCNLTLPSRQPTCKGTWMHIHMCACVCACVQLQSTYKKVIGLPRRKTNWCNFCNISWKKKHIYLKS